MIKAVIFDMDGLMIDSEPFHYQAFAKVLQAYGKQLTEETFNSLYPGISDIDQANDMVQRYDLPVSPEQLAAEKQTAYYALLEETITPKPGLMSLLQYLQEQNYLMAIASSSSLEEIQRVVDGLHIAPYITTICSAEEVAHGKPAPDIFLLAASRLGVDPSECLVLEDAPSGIWAAKDASMLRYAIPSEQTKDQNFAGANRILFSLRDVPNVLRQDAGK
jgi:beta-phosphoglucomutase family hydrolase